MAVDSSAFVHPTAIVEDGAAVGGGTKVWHHAHVRSGAKVGADCVLGKNVFIDSGVTIGKGCKIQNNVSLYLGVTLKDSVFVGPSVVFTNDLYPRAESADWQVESTIVESGATIGANATIVCGITIGGWATVAAGAVVTRDVAPHELVAGNPARRVGWMCACGRPLAKTQGEYRGEVCGRCGSSIVAPTHRSQA